jgi:hypothetical protein
MKQDHMVKRVSTLLSRIQMSCVGKDFSLIFNEDVIHGGRVYIQIKYESPCSKTGEIETWKGRKYYLSEFMSDDEIVKTCYVAFEQCIKHEVMEGFKVDGTILFNPHVNFEELLKISNKEVKR